MGNALILALSLHHYEKLRVIQYITKKVEMPLVKILVDIEEKGIEIDLNILESMSTGLTKSLTSLQEQIFTIVGEKFNLNSPKQLSDILFTKINLRKTRKIKTGYSTDSASLDSLKKALNYSTKSVNVKVCLNSQTYIEDPIKGEPKDMFDEAAQDLNLVDSTMLN